MIFYNALIIVIISSIINALPPKGCTSCLMVPIEVVEGSGISQTNKTRNSEGCFVQTVHCSTNKKGSETYIQFNRGRKGLFAAVEQTIQLFCNEKGQWEFRHSKMTLNVEVLSCISTP
ncbi:unnamed protein product [Caenorhabditis bovis]|uniref:C6 domain-containing protein n=1 Tax=Caenorhabditis bovis TaxID=2654633 RepID=A0A8S1ELJ1_9PELO|nr:unnamed protein product [Caenorhabditis bovis]